MAAILDRLGDALRDVWDALRDEPGGPTQRPLWGAIVRAGLRISVEDVTDDPRQRAGPGASRRRDGRYARGATDRRNGAAERERRGRAARERQAWQRQQQRERERWGSDWWEAARRDYEGRRQQQRRQRGQHGQHGQQRRQERDAPGRSQQRQERWQQAPPRPRRATPPAKVRQAYRTLGLSDTATRADATRARRALARRHHPDSGGDNHRMAAINAAHDTVAAWLRSGGAATV